MNRVINNREARDAATDNATENVHLDHKYLHWYISLHSTVVILLKYHFVLFYPFYFSEHSSTCEIILHLVCA